MVETWLRIGHQELLACNRNGRAERETLQTAQACSDLLTRIQTQAGMRKQA